MFELLYLDASALVKLIVVERETEALTAELRHWPQCVTIAVAQVELHRAALRASEAASLADSVLTGTSLLALTQSRLELARRVGSRHLRALDAIHLASAISLGDDLGAFCCYDRRLIADAEAADLNVLSPGLD